MATGSKAIREERLTAFEGMKHIMSKVERGEHLSVEERADFDARNARITKLDADLRTALEAEELSARMREDIDAPQAATIASPEARHEAAFAKYLRGGINTLGLDERSMITGGANTTSPGTGSTSGSNTPGFLVPPSWWQRLQVALKVYGGVANDFQRIETADGSPMMWATNNPTAVLGTLVGTEASTVSGVDYTFGQGYLQAFMYTSGVQLVSIQLAQDSAFDLDEFVLARSGEALGRAIAAAVISGTGSGQPQGIIPSLNGQGASSGASGGYVALTASAAVNMGGTASTELASNVLGVNSLRSLVAAVDPAYRSQGAKFYMNDAQLLGIRGLSDSNGRPLVNLQDGITPGAPTTIWGYEVVVDNNIPNLAASTTGGPIFGHLPSAMVARYVSGAGFRRLDERYADQLAIGYVGYMRFDSRSNDLRAAATVKPAAT